MSSILSAPNRPKTVFKVEQRGDTIRVELDKPTFEQMIRKAAQARRMI